MVEIPTLEKKIGSTGNKGQNSASVSAVIVNFNGGDRIIKCIQALTKQELPLLKIIVVDNGSTDGSIEEIRLLYPFVEIIELGINRGLPAARNIGLKRSETDMVLLIDNDVYVADDCIGKMLHAHKTFQATIVCPRIIILPDCEKVQCDGAAVHFIGTLMLRHAYQPVSTLKDEITPVNACIGACMLMERKKVLAAGGFDEAYFFYFEDLEFSYRFRSLGHRIYCDSRAIVYHDMRDGTPGLSFRGKGEYPVRRAYLTMRHRWLTILIHYRLRTIAVLFPALAIYELACLALSIRLGWVQQWFRAWIWQLAHFADILKRRRQVKSVRVFMDGDILEGGEIPLSRGFIQSGTAKFLVKTLSRLVNSYWKFAHRWIL